MIPVKWFTSDMTGAPQITGSDSFPTGELIALLDACLLNGFNAQGLDSLTYDSGTGKCTGTVNAGHGFSQYQVILIEGANEAAFNGEHRITALDATTFQFTPATAPGVATATGTITAKAAPVGQWEKAFSATNKAVYRSTDPLATGYYLRVDDTVSGRARPVRGYESMTDVDTGSNAFGHASGHFAVSSSGTNQWALVGDARLFYVHFRGGDYAGIAAFGDIKSFKPADVYHCVVIANGETSLRRPDNFTLSSYINSAPYIWRIARSENTTVLNPTVGLYGHERLNVPNPNPSDGNLYLNESPILVTADNDLRGVLPGIGFAHNDLGGGLQIVDDATNSANVFLVVRETNNNGLIAQPAFNLTGAWR
ncbi:hypothetical protein [Methylohalobius crimeensis]|uniref:hypothetical protein n=1 Tax=Methylohalobius crimeensis TaxID=244365 RepID=UPI0003B6DF11|nr:hypothetical protein [Methylohalobius crimeensis]